MAGQPTSPMSALERDVRAVAAAMTDAEWRSIRARCAEARFPAKSVIFSQAHISDRWLFVTEGVAASVQSSVDGEATIARFFETGQICGNLTSAWRRAVASDDLVAVTDVAGVLLPDRVLRAEYFDGGAFGGYLRRKIIETLLFDKELICAKTSTDTRVRYRFLEDNHDRVIADAPQKDIARFLGVTPQGLSRFLRGRKPPES